MVNLELSKLPEEVQKSVKLLADYGGAGNDYYSVFNTNYKSSTFLYDLQNQIEQKRYKTILNTLKNEFSMGINLDDKQVSDDEKIIRRSLREFGFSENDFFNPKFDKNDLVSWADRSGQEKIYKVDSVFKDSGAYLYNLRDLNSGIQFGGRLSQDEIKEPSVLQYVQHYKDRGNLEVHLFNKFCPLDKVTLDEKLELLFALKGVDIESKNSSIRDLANVAQKGYIDMTNHHNTLCMLADSSSFENNPISFKLKSDSVSAKEVLELEALAKKNMENIEKYRVITEDIKSIKSDLDYLTKNNPDDKKIKSLMDDSYFSDSYDGLNIESIGELYSSAHWTIKNTHPNLYAKIDSLYDKSIDFIQERDIYKLNRPDLSDLIKNAGMVRDLSRTDITMFRSLSRNEDFEHHSVYNSFDDNIETPSAELSIANNGYRRELFQTPTSSNGGCNFSYCEGDLSLIVPKNNYDFFEKLDNSINFYIEEEDIKRLTFDEIKSEMLEKLGITKDVSDELFTEHSKDVHNNISKEFITISKEDYVS
jgi:hypothetical protein